MNRQSTSRRDLQVVPDEDAPLRDSQQWQPAPNIRNKPDIHCLPAPSPSDQLIARKEDDLLMALPLIQRSAIESAFYRKMTQSEIAFQTGIPIGTIKARIRAGLRKLAGPLKPLWNAN